VYRPANIRLSCKLVMLIGFFSPSIGRANGVDLNDVQFRIENSNLVVSYKLANGTAGSIAVFNKLFDWRTSEHPVNPNRAYTSLINGVLKIRKAIPELPEGGVVEALEVPFLSIIGPGEVLAEEFRLDIPVTGIQAYRKPCSGSDLAKQVEVQIGWAPLAAIATKTILGASGPQPVVVDGDQAMASQQLVTAGRSLSVPTQMRNVRSESARECSPVSALPLGRVERKAVLSFR